MNRVLVVATSHNTQGGISEVLKLYEKSPIWQKYHCTWIETHINGNIPLKLWYLFKGMFNYIVRLPFYDIVHIHFSLAVSAKRKYPFFVLAKIFGKKTIIHLHCGSQINDVWNKEYQRMFEQCDCGIVLSENLKAIVEEHIKRPGKIKVVYNPCPIIKQEGTCKKKNNILFSGRLVEDKGYKDLIRAFALIAPRHLDWRLVMAGSGEMDTARAMMHELNIESQTELLGWVKKEIKHRVFSEAQVFCLPSYAEGFPMAVLDAWAYGLPVIATPVGGIPDIAEDGENMLLFQPGDVEKLANHLDRLMTDDLMRSKLSIEATKLSNTKFKLDTITSQVADIYNCI